MYRKRLPLFVTLLAVAVLGMGCARGVEGSAQTEEGVDYALFRVQVVDTACVATLVETGVPNPAYIQIMTSDGRSSQVQYDGEGTVVLQEQKIPGRGCAMNLVSAGIMDELGRTHGLTYCQPVVGGDIFAGTSYECAPRRLPPSATKESG
jgi:hypothetical protein